MYKKLQVFILFSLCSYFTFSQPLKLKWVAEYPCLPPSSLEYDKVTTDEEGGIYLLGKSPESITPPNGSPTILIRKYDKEGNLEWETKYNNPDAADLFRDCAFSQDGSLLIGGMHNTPPLIFGDRAELAKLDVENGNLLWETFIFDTLTVESQIYDIELGVNDDIFAFGTHNDDNEYDSTRAFVSKIVPETGDTLWTKVYPEMFGALEGKALDDGMRIFGVPESGPDNMLMDIDLEGNVVQSAILPREYFSSSVNTFFSFFDTDGFLISFGDLISKWEVSTDPIWSFDFSRGLPDMEGVVREAIVDGEGNIYATGYLQDTISLMTNTQTIKLSRDGELIWATTDRYTDNALFEGGVRIGASENHVLVSSQISNGEPFYFDYRPILYSKDDGEIIYDTLLDKNEFDVAYNIHYDSGHFYLLGRSYLSGSSEPEDYMYQLFQFKVDEPVSTTEEKGNQHAVHIYPNPANDKVTVEQPNGHFFDEIKWYDANGRLVFLDKIEAETQTIKLPPLPTGFYSVQLENGAAEYSEQLLIERP